jgi:hypothetical protein
LVSKLARSFSRCCTCARLLPMSVKATIFWDTVSKEALTWNRGGPFQNTHTQCRQQ